MISMQPLPYSRPMALGEFVVADGPQVAGHNFMVYTSWWLSLGVYIQ